MRVLDLFSGIGMYALGAEQAGHEVIGFCENDQWARKVLKKHWPTKPISWCVKSLNEALIALLGDSPARILAQETREAPEPMENAVDSFGRPLEPFAWWEQPTCSWRTWQRCSIEGWEPFLGPWPPAGMIANGIAYQRQPLAHPISAPESTFLHTITANEGKGVSLTEIGKRIGYSKAWTCHMLKAAGAPMPKILLDKNGSPRTRHGMRKHPTYYSWYSMKTRCGNPNHADYPNWGGRGITYDPRWECFLTFLEDMGPRPSKKHSLERKDNNGNYCKDNCIWQLKSKQCQNTRSTKLTMDKAREIRTKYAAGETPLKLSKEYGVGSSMIHCVVNNESWVETV